MFGNTASSRKFSGGGGGRGGGRSSTVCSGNSFKKGVSNAQGAQNVRLGSSNTSTGGQATQNDAHIQQPLRVVVGTSVASSTGAAVKPADASVQKSTLGLPKAPQTDAVSLNSGTTGHSTPVKGPVDASSAFPLQFGSLSPGVINGLQEVYDLIALEINVYKLEVVFSLECLTTASTYEIS